VVRAAAGRQQIEQGPVAIKRPAAGGIQYESPGQRPPDELVRCGVVASQYTADGPDHQNFGVLAPRRGKVPAQPFQSLGVIAEHELEPVGAEGHHRLPGCTPLQRLGNALHDVSVLVVPRRNAVQALGKKRVPPLQDSAALLREERMPAVHRFTAAVIVLFDEEAVAQAFLKQHAAVGPAVELDGESAAEPVARGGPQDELRERRVELVEDLFSDVIGKGYVRRRGDRRCERGVARLGQ
jgi:hypothetical protein